ncbi:cytochrome P450 [Phaeosphaeriaceae sp. SRC1lsM3a]|nr:cytochrome P450 [Stagonospora sp. SRC1lsM3a]
MYRIYAGDSHSVQRRLHEQFGPIIRIAPDEVVTTDPEALRKIYRNQGPLSKTDFYTVWGAQDISEQVDNFVQTDERLHSNYRRIVNPVYTLSNVLKSEMYINKVSELFLQRLDEHASRNEVMDLGHWLQMYAFDVIGEIFFGKMFGFLHNSEDHGAYIASLDALVPLLCVIAIAPRHLRPFIGALMAIVPAAVAAAKSLDSIRTAALAAVGGRMKSIRDGSSQRGDMMSQLFDIVHEKGEKVNFSHREVTLESYSAMFAGSDTTAVAFRTTFYHLMRHPAAMAKARGEIDAALAEGSLSSPIKYSETINKLPYICASIKEAMRMHPSVGLSMQRHAPESGIELAGKFIPAGWRVGMNPAVFHYEKSIFGADADEFRPERWLVSPEEWKAMDRNILTFGAGTRTCIGKNISLVELHTLVPEILRRFDLQLTHDRPWSTSNQWFHKQSGITVRLARRELV